MSPLPCDKRNSGGCGGSGSILARLVKIAWQAELHATGKRISHNPIVCRVAAVIRGGCGADLPPRGVAAVPLQPLAAAVLCYCRLVDSVAMPRANRETPRRAARRRLAKPRPAA